jgi:hypothetical protein
MTKEHWERKLFYLLTPALMGDPFTLRCDRSYTALTGGDAPSIYISNYNTGEGQKISKDAIDESRFGDKRQDDLFASVSLGRYFISVRHFNVKYTSAGRGIRYQWHAEVVVVDGLGVNPANVGDPDSPGVAYKIFRAIFGAEGRAVTVAVWPIQDEGVCCKPK